MAAEEQDLTCFVMSMKQGGRDQNARWCNNVKKKFLLNK